MANANKGFTISKDGVLKNYKGKDEQVIIPDGVIFIGDYAFSAFGSDVDVISVTIPEGVNGIGAGAFYNCKNLKEITIPKSVKSIGDEAF